MSKLTVAFTIGVLLVGAGTASAISADIVFLIDTSASMSNDIAEVKARVGDFNTAMINAGIDAQYGLVRFGGFVSLIQDITTFAPFQATLNTLVADQGNPENGSDAVNAGLVATFRPGAVKNFILITDEDDDSGLASFNAANAGLGAQDALFNFIGVPGVGNTDARYGVLASTHGGAAFNIGDFRSDPAAFFDNFTRTKVAEIIPEPGTLVLLGGGLGLLGFTAIRRRRRKAA